MKAKSKLAAALFFTGLSACGTLERSSESGYATTTSDDDDNSTSGLLEPSSPLRSPAMRSPASLTPLPNRPNDVENIVNSGDIAIGMSRFNVRESWGLPAFVEVAGSTSNGNERWTYEQDVATVQGYTSQKKIIIFRQDRVVGWKTINASN